MTGRSILAMALAVAFCGVAAAQDGPSWLLDGPIYETHPYYYDGTFKALTDRLPSLADLGIKTIYLMPIWEHEAGDPPYELIYLIDDYTKVDPPYGAPEDLKDLVVTAHRLGLKVLFDLVTTATPPGSVIWNHGWTLSIALPALEKLVPDLQQTAYQGEVYVFHRSIADPSVYDVFGRLVGGTVVLHCYPNYQWGPAVDRSNPEVIRYFSEVAAYYVREFDIDGWRVDAPSNNWNPAIISGDHSSLGLLRSVKQSITAVKPSAVLYSEGPFLANRLDSDIENAAPVLDECAETSYSYLFMLALADGRLRTSEQLVAFLTHEKVWFGRARSRFVETHDTARVRERAPRLAKPLLVLTATIPGVPMIQAGQEIGAGNEWFHQWYTTPPAPLPVDPRVDWAHGDLSLREFYREVFAVRARHDALIAGSIADAWRGGTNTLAFTRTTNGKSVVVVINLGGAAATSTLAVPFGAGTTLRDALSGAAFEVSDPDNFIVTVPAYGARILIPESRIRRRLPRSGP